MSFDSVPSRSEVMGWNARSLADYMKRLRLSSCDKVVMKTSMNGARFLKMKDGDLQKFPTIHIPVITEICSEINRSEEERGFSQRSREPKRHQQDFVQEEDEAWDSETFDMSDNGYENPDEDDSYICALSDRLPPAEGEEQEGSDGDYETPPSATEEIPRLLNLPKPLGNSDYIDSVRGGPSGTLPTGRIPRLPQRPGPQALATSHNTLARPPTSRLDPSPQRPFKAAGKRPSVPMVDRSKKPGQPAPTKKQHHTNTKTTPTRECSPFSSPQPAIVKPPQLKGPKPPDYRPSSSKPPSMVPNTMPGTEKDIDPEWYGGLVTRGQAEASLRWVNKDGAFLVRDSSKGSSEQPYTLMVLNQGKVYNIQIRHQGNTYHLGTGLMGSESFPGVEEIIEHHTYTPLLLIDMENGTGAQSQCCLLHPAPL
ncbi:lymphocyte cytosolic protein 2 isoform X2 [Oncorhynchus kisutch]|uniref:Lymphocyte cytosolic protein 2 n=1 Tax=Oncorhynchus kisutch TaxID=8019 RepID=A0A8C7MPQ0_ONCKI|nr:lymphocyte cytosolic protein 2 isoform X2 [Oncorhynchus kisutch]